MAKRKYVKNKEKADYWKQLSVKGKENIKLARQVLNIVKTKESTEYVKYVKKYYAISKYLRKGKVKVTEVSRAKLKTEEEFNDYVKIFKKKGVELARESYSMLSYKSGAKLREMLKSKDPKFKLTIQQARTKQLTDKMWKEITKDYDKLAAEYEKLKKEGLTGTQAAMQIAVDYFGS